MFSWEGALLWTPGKVEPLTFSATRVKKAVRVPTVLNTLLHCQGAGAVSEHAAETFWERLNHGADSSPTCCDDRVPVHFPPPLSDPLIPLCPTTCLFPSQAWNVLALDGSNWQKIDLFNFQTDIEVSGQFW